MKMLFLYLTGFTGTGGIEKFNRAFLKALYEFTGQRSTVINHPSSISFKAFSLYDDKYDARYINSESFRGFKGNRARFILASVREGLKSDLIILGHINLSPVGLAINKLKNGAKLFLITHGIEVWNSLSHLKKSMLSNTEIVISVSNFTKQKLIHLHGISSQKIKILPDTIDPYFKIPKKSNKPRYLKKRYSIENNTKVILTVSRLSSTEQYKGYDKVIQSLPEVIKNLTLRACRENPASSQLPNFSSSVKYIIVGKADNDELKRIKVLIKKLRLEDYVILPGYIPDAELLDHYNLCDVFVMPSDGEGFGIVFLEAIACGKPVIAGNKDASPEAVLNGELGFLVDSDNINEIGGAIIKVLEGKVNGNLLNGKFLRKRVIEKYGFERFKKRLQEIVQIS